MGEKEPTRIGVEGGSEPCARATAETKRNATAASRVVMGGYDLRLKTTNPTSPYKAPWDRQRRQATAPSHDSHGRPYIGPRGFAHPAFRLELPLYRSDGLKFSGRSLGRQARGAGGRC